MSTVAVIDYLSNIHLFQDYGPWPFLGGLFLLNLGNVLRGAADVIRALAKWKGRK